MHDRLFGRDSLVKRKVDRLVVDPPRGGMDKKALCQLLDLRAPVLVYVSCNPRTAVRDVVRLAAAGYRPVRIQPVDLFPHTHHVEAVSSLELVGSAARIL